MRRMLLGVMAAGGLALAATAFATPAPQIPTYTGPYGQVPFSTSTAPQFPNLGASKACIGTDTNGALTAPSSCPSGGGGGGGGTIGPPLETHVAASATELDFTACLSSTYDVYEVDLTQITGSGATLALQFSQNGGATWDSASNYYTSQYSWSSGGAGAGGPGTGGNIYLAPFDSGGRTIASAQPSGGFIKLFSPASGAIGTDVWGSLTVFDSASSTIAQGLEFRGFYSPAVVNNAFRIVALSGTFSGTVRCYGLANSPTVTTVPQYSDFTAAHVPTGATSGQGVNGITANDPDCSCSIGALYMQALAYDTAPSSTFTVTTVVDTAFPNSGNNSSGLYISDGTHQLTLGADQASGAQGVSNCWTGYNFTSNPFNNTGPLFYRAWRIRFDGTDYYLYGGPSVDSMQLLATYSSAQCSLGAVTAVGLFQHSYSSTSTSGFSYFTLTTP